MLQMSTMGKKDVPHLAELMINGSTMGITQTTQDIKAYNMSGTKAIELANELISLQQNHINRLKNFL